METTYNAYEFPNLILILFYLRNDMRCEIRNILVVRILILSSSSKASIKSWTCPKYLIEKNANRLLDRADHMQLGIQEKKPWPTGVRVKHIVLDGSAFQPAIHYKWRSEA